MKKISVELADRSYPIFIAPGLLGRAELLDDYIKGQKVCIVTNQTVSPLYLDKLKAMLNAYQLSTFAIADGEQFKTLQTYHQVLDHLLGEKVDRQSTVIALGGGVVGDLTGFAAASCLRGINFIQVPTTLLAQVDSSVGGKTGVNHKAGKNLVGAFYQPACVVADLDTLDTLPQREYAAGMAEVIKYGLIRDAVFFEWIESHVDLIKHKDKASLAHIVARSCEIKAQVVSMDETEQGLRAILNLGHTFGHAIEAAMQYRGWLHGEAISAGMVMAADLSRAMGYIDTATVQRICRLLQRFDLPTAPPESISVEQMKTLMLQDKKTLDSIVRLILIKQLGDAFVSKDYDRDRLDQTLNSYLST